MEEDHTHGNLLVVVVVVAAVVNSESSKMMPDALRSMDHACHNHASHIHTTEGCDHHSSELEAVVVEA